MKVNYKELMKKLGVDRPLNVYETQPWLILGDDGMACEGEVRCNHDQSEIEAELQFIHEYPIDGVPPVEQICLIGCVKQKCPGDQYKVISCFIRGEDWKGKIYDWETKSCNFFRACIREIRLGKIPDIDKILSREMSKSGVHGRGQGGGSDKSQKIKPNQLLYDRKNSGSGF